MTPGDVARVLAKAAAFDQRTIGESDVLAWHEAIGELDAADALAAVSRHYATSDRRIMPMHVLQLAASVADERRRAGVRAARERATLDAGPDPARGPLRDRADDVRALVAGVRVDLPAGDPEALRPRAKHWEREHATYVRQQAAEPNPDYDPTMRPVPEWTRSKAEPEGIWWENDDARERHAKTLLAEAGRLAGRPAAHEAS